MRAFPIRCSLSEVNGFAIVSAFIIRLCCIIVPLQLPSVNTQAGRCLREMQKDCKKYVNRLSLHYFGSPPLTGGRARSNLARASAWSFRPSRVRDRSSPRTPASLWSRPGCRSDLRAHQFKDTPHMIGQATGHGRSSGFPRPLPLFRVGGGAAQLMMRPTEMRGAAQQVHPGVQSCQPMSGMPTVAC